MKDTQKEHNQWFYLSIFILIFIITLTKNDLKGEKKSPLRVFKKSKICYKNRNSQQFGMILEAAEYYIALLKHEFNN